MENTNKFAAQGRTKLITGTILMPELAGLRLIMVPCSEAGKPDTDLHKLLDRKWQTISKDLKGWYSHHMDFKLGSISTSAVQSDTWAVHCLCFDKSGTLNEAALVSCMKKISALALSEKASVHIAATLLDVMPSLQDLVAPWLLEKGVHAYFYEETSAVKAAAEALAQAVPVVPTPVVAPVAVLKRTVPAAIKAKVKAGKQKKADKDLKKKVNVTASTPAPDGMGVPNASAIIETVSPEVTSEVDNDAEVE